MSSVLEQVSSELFKEVKHEYLLNGHLSDSILSALNCVFGQPLLSALDLVDKRAVARLYSQSGREVFQVCGSSGRTYVCPDSLQFCPCMSFSFGVIKRGELLLISVAMETSAVFFFLCLSLLVAVQMTTWPFLLNLCLSSFITVFMLYFALLTVTLLPLESLLLQLYEKTATKSNKADSKELESSKVETGAENAFDDEITRKLREIIGHIIRDFILDWYNTVSDDVHFVQQAFEIFEHIFMDVRVRVSKVESQRLARILLCHLSRHYRCYRRAMLIAEAQSGKDSDRHQQLMVVTYEKLNGHLAMSNLPDTEADHLRSMVAVLLKALLPKDYSLSGTSLYLVRELISRNVLFPFIDMLSRPTWICEAVVKILEDEKTQAEEDNKNDESSSCSSSNSSNQTEIEAEDENTSTIANSAPQDPIMMDFRTAVYKPEEEITEKSLTARYSTSADNELIDLGLSLLPDSQVSEGSEDLFTITSDTDQEADLNINNGVDLTVGSATSSVNSQSLINDAELSHFADSIDVSLSSSQNSNLSVNSRHLREQNTITRGGFASPKMMEKSAGSRNSVQEQRIFQHLRIPETLTTDEAFDGGSKYTLYKITYTAPEPQVQPKKRFKSPFTKTVENPPADSSSMKLKDFQVCRRFREFLTLQDRINENNMIRKLIQSVRGPSRMFPMPIGNMDKEYIEKRRLFLQAYLRELCSYSLVSQCAEMKEFLAYNSDPRLAYVRRPSDIIPRFDKMIKNAVQEFLGSASLKITDHFASDDDDDFYVPTPQKVPIKPSQSLPQFPNKLEEAPDGQSELPRSTTQCVLSHSQQKFGAVTKFKNMVLGRPNTPAIFQEFSRDFSAFSGPRNANQVTFGRSWRTPENLLTNRNRFQFSTSNRRTQGDGCDVMDTERDGDARYLGEYLISGQIFRLTRAIWKIGLGVNSLSFLSTARFVTEFINRELHSLTVKDKWMLYLTTLQETLWPKGEWKSNDTKDEETYEHVFEEAAKSLEATLPDVIPLLIGQSRYSKGVKELLESFQNQTINRHLVYHLLDTTVKLLFPDLQSILACRSNISM